jgi:hypothetical protein
MVCLSAVLWVPLSTGAVAAESVRVILDVAKTTLRSGEILEVPVCIEDGATDVMSYALRFRYNPRVLKLREIRGGNFSGFDTPPVVGPEIPRRGQRRFTANNSLFLATPETFNVATVVFEVVGQPGDRGWFRIGRTKWGDVTTRSRYRQPRRVKFPPPVHVDVVE